MHVFLGIHSVHSICKLCKNMVKWIYFLTLRNSHLCGETDSVHINKYCVRNSTKEKRKLEHREAGVRRQRLSVWCSKSSDLGWLVSWGLWRIGEEMGRTQQVEGQKGKNIEFTAPIPMSWENVEGEEMFLERQDTESASGDLTGGCGQRWGMMQSVF